MKKVLCLLMCLLLLPAMALSEEMTFQEKVTVDQNAEYLDMGDVKIQDLDAFMNFLDQMPHLKKVDMFATPVKKAQIETLAARFPAIEFGWTMVIAEHTIRTDQTAFSTLHNNQSAHHSSADFSILKYCKNLLALDVGHNAVDDLSFLYDLPQLKVLILACNQITDITPLASLKNLEYVELFKNRITDLGPIAEWEHVLDLNICFNRVKDYTPIMGLTSVERLWMYNSNNYTESDPVPKDTVRAIKEALPNAYVDSTHYSTTGGWREHDRYFVIFEMFKTGTYIPFDTAEEAAE